MEESNARSDELFARLKRLRRGVDAPVRAPLRAREALPEWFKRRLGRAPGASGASSAVGVGAVEPRAPRVKSLGAPRDLVSVDNRFGAHAERVVRLPCDALHGRWRLEDARTARSSELAWLANDDALAGLALERAAFLDIETTGLSGGAGTYVFLVGLARFVDDGCELWQGFARGPDEEAALLAHVAARIAASDGLVTFFGKSFDRHRLQDKMRVHGIEPPFAGRAHLDLYHPLKRLYGGAFADGRLATLERALCGVERERDLPGSFAPAAWFDFLAGRPHLLEEVFRHNFDDVQSLVTLAAHLSRTRDAVRADGEPLEGPAALRCGALARMAARRREWGAALAWLERPELGSALERSQELLRVQWLARVDRAAEALDSARGLAAASDAVAAHAALLAARLAHRRGLPEAREFALRAGDLASRTLAGAECVRVAREARKLAESRT